MNYIKRLTENKGIKDFISPEQVQIAEANYSILDKSPEGQLEILEDAKHGVNSAIDYIYYKAIPLITYTFNKYYVGDNKFKKAKYMNKEDYDFGALAYELLLNVKNKDPKAVSPLKAFKADSFKTLKDPLKKFNYYFMRYLQAESFKLHRSNKQVGDGQETSYDEIVDNPELYNADSNLQVIDNNIKDVETRETVKVFVEELEKYNKKLVSTFIYILANPSDTLKIASKKLGISEPTIRTYTETLNGLWKEFVT